MGQVSQGSKRRSLGTTTNGISIDVHTGSGAASRRYFNGQAVSPPFTADSRYDSTG